MIQRSFYFLRHGETDWNKESRLQGWTDTTLNSTGQQQASDAIASITRLPIDALVVSPLLRARQTADIINAQWQKPLVIDPRLRERNFGIFEGMIPAEIDAWKEKATGDKSLVMEENGYPLPDKAEPYEDFKQRALSSIAEHLDHNPAQNLMFIAHGGIYRVLRRFLLGDVHQSSNVQPWLFENNGPQWHAHALSNAADIKSAATGQ